MMKNMVFVLVVPLAAALVGCGSQAPSRPARPELDGSTAQPPAAEPASSTPGPVSAAPSSGVHVNRGGGITATSQVGNSTVTSEIKPPSVTQVITGNTAPQTSVGVNGRSGAGVRVENSAPTNGEMFADLIVNGNVDTRNRQRVIVTDKNGRSTDLTRAYNTGKAIGTLLGGR